MIIYVFFNLKLVHDFWDKIWFYTYYWLPYVVLIAICDRVAYLIGRVEILSNIIGSCALMNSEWDSSRTLDKTYINLRCLTRALYEHIGVCNKYKKLCNNPRWDLSLMYLIIIIIKNTHRQIVKIFYFIKI